MMKRALEYVVPTVPPKQNTPGVQFRADLSDQVPDPLFLLSAGDFYTFPRETRFRSPAYCLQNMPSPTNTCGHPSIAKENA